jgi:hypothetical protein
VDQRLRERSRDEHVALHREGATSRRRYIEKVVDGQIAELHTDDFTGFLLEMRRNLRHIRDEIQAGASAAVAVGSAESVLACS